MSIFEILTTTVTGIALLASVSAVVVALLIAKFKKLDNTLNSIYGTENELKKRIEQYVAKVARDELSELVDNYKQTLEVSSREIIDTFKEATERQITSMASFIREQEGLITRQAEFVVGEITKKAQVDIEDYKKLQFDGIDLQVGDVVNRISREVLGKVISKEEHEQLIWDAVQRAKAQGVFKEGSLASLQADSIGDGKSKGRTGSKK